MRKSTKASTTIRANKRKAKLKAKHRRQRARAAVGAVEAHYPNRPEQTRIVPEHPKIADQVTRRGGAVLSPPSIEGPDLFRSFEPVVADREERFRQIKFVRPAAAVVIHIGPVIGHQPIERIPQRQIVGIQHLPWFLPSFWDGECRSWFPSTP